MSPVSFRNMACCPILHVFVYVYVYVYVYVQYMCVCMYMCVLEVSLCRMLLPPTPIPPE